MSTVKCPYCAEEIQAEAVKCKHCGSWLGPGDPAAGPGLHGPGPAGEGYPPAPPLGGSLRRSTTNKMLAGVCGGLGKYLGIDPVLVRVLYALVTFFTAIVPGILVYVLLALIVPPDDRPTAWGA